MTDKFRVGDRVKIIKAVTQDWVGREATVLSPKTLRFHEELGDIYAYLLDIQGEGSFAPDGVEYGAPEDWLASIYDGWEKTEWKDCYWKPKEMVKLE